MLHSGWLFYAVILLAASFPFLRVINGTRKEALEAKRMKRHLADYLKTQG